MEFNKVIVSIVDVHVDVQVVVRAQKAIYLQEVYKDLNL